MNEHNIFVMDGNLIFLLSPSGAQGALWLRRDPQGFKLFLVSFVCLFDISLPSALSLYIFGSGLFQDMVSVLFKLSFSWSLKYFVLFKLSLRFSNSNCMYFIIPKILLLVLHYSLHDLKYEKQPGHPLRSVSCAILHFGNFFS